MSKNTIINKRRKQLSKKRMVPLPCSQKLVYSVCHNGITFLPIQLNNLYFQGPQIIKYKLQKEIIPLINKQCSKIWFQNHLFCQKQKVFQQIYFFLKIFFIILSILIITYLFIPNQLLPSICNTTIFVILIFWLLSTISVFYTFFVPFKNYQMDQLIKDKISQILLVYNIKIQNESQYQIKFDDQCLWITVSPIQFQSFQSKQNYSQMKIFQ